MPESAASPTDEPEDESGPTAAWLDHFAERLRLRTEDIVVGDPRSAIYDPADWATVSQRARDAEQYVYRPSRRLPADVPADAYATNIVREALRLPIVATARGPWVCHDPLGGPTLQPAPQPPAPAKRCRRKVILD